MDMWTIGVADRLRFSDSRANPESGKCSPSPTQVLPPINDLIFTTPIGADIETRQVTR